MGWKSLKAKVITKLNTIKATSEIAEINDHNKSSGDYPMVNVDKSESPSDYYTSAGNLRQYIFILKIKHEIDKNNKGESAVETLLEELVDDIMDLFDGDRTLGDSCHILNATPSAWGWSNGVVGIERVATVRLTCQVYKE